jgi:PAS domain S-box-containing protein
VATNKPGVKPPKKYEDALLVFGYFIDKLNFEVILTDETLNVEWLNRAARKRFQQSESLYGKNWHCYLSPENHDPDTCDLCKNILVSEDTFSENIEVERDGSVRYLQVLGFVLELPVWETRKYLIILEDITEPEKNRREASSLQRLMNPAIQDSGDAFIITDENNTINSWNFGAELIFGYTPEEAEGKKIDFVLPEHALDKVNAREIRNQGEKTHIIRKLETSARHKNGGDIAVDLTCSEVYDLNGRLEGRSFIAKDITQRKILQNQLKHFVQEFYKLNTLSEHLHRSTDMDDLIRTVLLALTTGGGLNFDRAFLCFIDREHNLIKGESAMGPSDKKEAEDFISLKEKRDFFEILMLLRKTGLKEGKYKVDKLVKKFTVNLEDKNNLLVNSVESGKTFFIKDGRLPDYPGDQLQGAENLTELLGTGDIAVIPLSGKHDPIGILIVDNGYSRRPIPIEDLEILRVFVSQASLAIENARLHKKSQEHYEELSSAYLRLQEQQDEMLKYQRLAALGEMSAKIAHEIRNPLVSMGGLAKAIDKMSDKGSKVHRFASLIYQQAINLETLLENMLLLAGPRPLNPTEQNIRNIVEEIIFSLKFAKDCGECEIINRIPEELILNIDGYKIRQVMTNLMRNAIQAMGKGGKLEIYSSESDDSVEIHFRDYGPGIPDKNRDKLFEPFFTTKKDGTGLGLTISRQIMKQHGGEILAKSMLPKGTDMVLHFPKNGTNHNT